MSEDNIHEGYRILDEEMKHQERYKQPSEEVECCELLAKAISSKAKAVNKKYKGAWIEIFPCGKAGRVSDNEEIFETFDNFIEFILS